MDFFLEIHNRECGLDGLFCDHQRDHGPSVLNTSSAAWSLHQETVSTQAGRIQNEEMNKESALS